MKRLYYQSHIFSATRAQMRVLRAIHRGEPVKTNGATMACIHRLLEFPPGGGVRVRPEIVKNLGLDKGQAWECPACGKTYPTYAAAKCCREIPIPR